MTPIRSATHFSEAGMGRQANIARNMWQGAQCHAPRTGNVVRKKIQPVRFDSIGPCHMPMGFANQYDMGQTVCHLGWLWKIHDWTFLAEIQQAFPPWLSMICVCRSSSLHFCEWISGSCTVPPPVQRPCPCCQSCEPSTSRAELSELWLESRQQKQKLPITSHDYPTINYLNLPMKIHE